MRLPPPPPNTNPVVNPFAGLPTIFTVLGKLGLELRGARGHLAGIHRGAHRAPGRQLAITLYYAGSNNPLIFGNVPE
jgi:hypothetical protein